VPTVRHADYIGSWLEVLREDNRAIVRAASAASKAADFLLAFASDGEQAGDSTQVDGVVGEHALPILAGSVHRTCRGRLTNDRAKR
jgi:antirestriction protein ArdC